MYTTNARPQMECEIEVSDLALAGQPDIEQYILDLATQYAQNLAPRDALSQYALVNPRVIECTPMDARRLYRVEFDLEPVQ